MFSKFDYADLLMFALASAFLVPAAHLTFAGIVASVGIVFGS
tara:strand:- start:212 stop:337 length:126 start_codon:yes stop_codon:yes gene_type:complete